MLCEGIILKDEQICIPGDSDQVATSAGEDRIGSALELEAS